MYKSRTIFWTDFKVKKVDLYTGKYGTLRHLSVVCYDVSYRVSYRGTCTKICIGC